MALKPAVGSEFFLVEVDPLGLSFAVAITCFALLERGCPNDDPVKGAFVVVIPVDNILRTVPREIGSGMAPGLLLCAVRGGRFGPRQIDQHIRGAAYQRLDQDSPEEVRQVRALAIAVLDKVAVERLPGFVGPLKTENRLPSKQRGGVPIYDRSHIVLVEDTTEPLAVHVHRLLVPLDEILGRACVELVPAGVQVLVLLPG